MSANIQFIQYAPEQLKSKITISVEKILKSKKGFKKVREAVKIIKMILRLQHLVQLIKSYLLYNHPEILGFLSFVKNTFMEWFS